LDQMQFSRHHCFIETSKNSFQSPPSQFTSKFYFIQFFAVESYVPVHATTNGAQLQGNVTFLPTEQCKYLLWAERMKSGLIF
jgi:hypothetical protein